MIHYSYLKALQEEGNYPLDAGAWSVTVRRLAFGEGLPIPNSPFYRIPLAAGNGIPPIPPIPSSQTDPEVYASYRQLYSAKSAERYLKRYPGIAVEAGFPLSKQWISPPSGRIVWPDPNKLDFDRTHSVPLWLADSDEKRFIFPNSWGEEWGDHGYGSMPYAFFENALFESFIFDYVESINPETSPCISPLPGLLSTAPLLYLQRVLYRTESNERHYVFTVEISPRQRYGWAFVTERDGALEVEELYVRRESRNKGVGTVLLNAVSELGAAKNLPLRVLIHWTEMKSENREAYELMCKLVERLGCTFVRHNNLRHPYVAVEGAVGTYYPEEPSPIPSRPRTPLVELAMAFGLAFNDGIEADPPMETVAAVSTEKKKIEYVDNETLERELELLLQCDRELLERLAK